MKKIILVILFLIALKLNAQVDVSGGMGISFVSNSALKDYINIYFADRDNELSSFYSTVEVFTEVDYTLSSNFQIGFDYLYQYFSYSTSFGGIGQYKLSYAHHKPSIIAYYVISGEGYKFKFGGGFGPRFISLDEMLPITVKYDNYTKTGIGLLGRVQGHTLLSGDVYANVGLDVRYDAVGEPSTSNGAVLGSKANADAVNLNSLSVSVRIGVSYFF